MLKINFQISLLDTEAYNCYISWSMG